MKKKYLGWLALLGVCALDAAELSWQRNYADFTELPVVTLKSAADESVVGELELRLTDSASKVILQEVLPYRLDGEGVLTFGNLDALPPLRESVLCEVIDRSGQLTPASLSGIFGVKAPYDRKIARPVGMNVHLGWYAPEIRWKLLPMLKEAGVSTVRVDCGFVDLKAEPEKAEKTARDLEEELIGLEAFGMEPLVLLGYFPESFYASPEKAQMAYEWSRWLAERFQGRASWHYGNETNSGWAGFGAAADMGELHKAYALGSAAGDPQALRGSFGIAEGLPGYTQAFLNTGAEGYLEALCIHPYSGTPEAGIAKILANRKLLKPGTQIWATELGFHVDDTEVGLNPLTMALTRVMGFSTEQQRDFLSRLFVLGRSFGIDRLYWYNFYGKNDGETFWLVNGEYQPKPAFYALKNVSRWLDSATPLGASPLDAPVQRHFFRRPDGRIFCVLWAQGNVQTQLHGAWLRGAEVYDVLGEPVGVESEALTLDASPRFLLMPEKFELNELVSKEVIASAMNGRSFHEPAHRFIVQPGEEITIPYSFFNALDTELQATVAVVKGFPNWGVTLPDAVTLAAHATTETQVKLHVPADAVPGVEYHWSIGADLSNGQQVRPMSIRIQTRGEFPYRAIAAQEQVRNYPMWNSMREPDLGTGREETSAKKAAVQVDGKLTEWQPEEFVELDQTLSWLIRDPDLPMREDFTVKVAFRWDNTFLYAGFLVEDDDLSCLDTVSRDWRDNDNLRIFLSAEADETKRGDTLSKDELLLIMAPRDLSTRGAPMAFAAVLGGYVHENVEKELRLAAQLWQTGYVLEVAIPWSQLQLDPRSGMSLGLNVLADDADDGFRRHTAMTTLKSADYWMNPKSLGKLLLTGD